MTKRSLRIPHTLVLMVGMMIFAIVLTWVLPAGSFEQEITETGRAVVVPGTFMLLEAQPLLPPWSLFTVVPRAMADAQAVIFFVFIVGGVIALLQTSGAIDALIGRALHRFRARVGLLIFVAMLMFGIFSASFGMAAEYIAFVGILVALCAALKLDTMTAIGMMVVGYGIGYGCALLNPFTVVVAQEVAGLEVGSGIGYRALIAGPIFLIGFHHVLSYARRVQADPAASLLAGIESAQALAPVEYPQMNLRHTMVLLSAVVTLGVLIWGIVTSQWYLTELSALFLAFGVGIALISGMGFTLTANTFITGAAQLTGTALLIGFARAIALILEDGMVLHTLVNGLATPLAMVPAELSAIGMLLIQTLLNLFIPSGSGQAFATMPIMAPMGDIVGVSRQIAVLAFQFGDGFSNMLVPTNAVLMGILGIAGIPYAQWLRFILPLMLKLLAAASVALVIAVWIGYQ